MAWPTGSSTSKPFMNQQSGISERRHEFWSKHTLHFSNSHDQPYSLFPDNTGGYSNNSGKRWTKYRCIRTNTWNLVQCDNKTILNLCLLQQLNPPFQLQLDSVYLWKYQWLFSKLCHRWPTGWDIGTNSWILVQLYNKTLVDMCHLYRSHSPFQSLRCSTWLCLSLRILVDILTSLA